MNNQTFFVLKVTFGSLSALCGILAAWYELRNRWQTEEERAKARVKYGKKWRTIRDLGILEMAENVISWLLKMKTKLRSMPEKMEWHYWLIIPSYIFVMIGGALEFGLLNGLLMGAPVPLVIIGFMFMSKFGSPFDDSHSLFSGFFSLVIFFLFSISAFFALLILFFGGIIWLKIFINLPLIYSPIAIIIFFPFYFVCFGLFWRLSSAEDPQFGYLAELFFYSVVFSFSVTLFAFNIGHLMIPTAWIPKTYQMFLSNVFCDGVTMIATILILGVAVGPKRKLSIPIAIVLDIIAATLLACGSLWFGLVRTENALSIREVLFVFIGKSPEGTHCELGPYFWAMHTTFLPTLFYLSIILLCWIGKIIVLPIVKVLMKGEAVEKPHHLTAGLFFLVAAIFFALWTGIGFLEESREKKLINSPETKQKVVFIDKNKLEDSRKKIIEASGSQRPLKPWPLWIEKDSRVNYKLAREMICIRDFFIKSLKYL